MEITKLIKDKELTLSLKGRLDSTTAPELQQTIDREIGNNTTLVIDLNELDYISSAGLRVLLSAQKLMNAKGELIVTNVNEVIKEVFEITGFDEILTIK